MKLSSKYTVGAPPDRVFAALTDPRMLERCIPGCEELRPAGEHRYDARVKIGVAGLKGVYTGTAELADLDPPNAFMLSVNGKGAPGFVRAAARVSLAPDGQGGTTVASDADVQVGGLIAAVGSRLIEAASRQQMDAFFKALASQVAAG
jgi:carbon monoxide dehydrogenase subunit G